MIKPNGNLKPKPFLKKLISKGSIADNGSSMLVISTINNRNPEHKFLPTNIYNENAFGGDSYTVKKVPEIKSIYLEIYELIKDLKDTFCFYKIKGNYVANKDAFEYSYYLIPKDAILNDHYRAGNKNVAMHKNNRNNIIIEINPNYIFDEKYVSIFVNKGNSVINDNVIIPIIKISDDGTSGFNLIDFHSYIKDINNGFTKTTYPIDILNDGKYPVILSGFRGNSSDFKYMAHLVVKTMKVGDISYKQGFIFDYNSPSISKIQELYI